MEKPLCVLTIAFALLLTTIGSQMLFDDENYADKNFNHGRKIERLRDLVFDTEKRLKETTIKLKMVKEEKESIYSSYIDLLRMYSNGEVPNDQTIDGICARHPRLIIKNAHECHTYYNCSGVDTALSGWVDPYKFWPSIYKHECYYPFAFSDKTLQCENYTKVDCGTRHLPTWQCGYFREKCHLSHCIPCEIRYPNCENKTDGLWPQPEREYSNTYMICKDERLVSEGYCQKDIEWNVQSYPYQGKCVHAYAIPQEQHTRGLLPSCRRKVDGNYQYPGGECKAFYKCISGSASAVRCPHNTIFDSVKRLCEVGGKCVN